MRSYPLLPFLAGLLSLQFAACSIEPVPPGAFDDDDSAGADANEADAGSDDDHVGDTGPRDKQSDDDVAEADDEATDSDDEPVDDAGLGGESGDDDGEDDGPGRDADAASDDGISAADDDAVGDDDADDDGDAGRPASGMAGDDDSAPDAGDLAADGGASLPEGACVTSPPDPANGTYADCAGSLDGETCVLTCGENLFGGMSTCTDGAWSEKTCVPLGTLAATIGDAVTGDAVADAVVYVEGFFDPETEGCADSAYCQTSNEQGNVSFDAFPLGPQSVVIVKAGFDEIALPIDVAPADTANIRLDALPTGFLDGNLVVLLGWSALQDLDLGVGAPVEVGETTETECVFYDAKGSLEVAPFVQLDHDARRSVGGGTETIRVALNEDGSGLYYAGTYSVVVSSGQSLSGSSVSVRVIQARPSGAAQVTLFELPEDAVGATGWHVVDIEGDGTLSGGGETETDPAVSSDITCLDTLNGL